MMCEYFRRITHALVVHRFFWFIGEVIALIIEIDLIILRLIVVNRSRVVAVIIDINVSCIKHITIHIIIVVFFVAFVVLNVFVLHAVDFSIFVWLEKDISDNRIYCLYSYISVNRQIVLHVKYYSIVLIPINFIFLEEEKSNSDKRCNENLLDSRSCCLLVPTDLGLLLLGMVFVSTD